MPKAPEYVLNARGEKEYYCACSLYCGNNRVKVHRSTYFDHKKKQKLLQLGYPPETLRPKKRKRIDLRPEENATTNAEASGSGSRVDAGHHLPYDGTSFQEPEQNDNLVSSVINPVDNLLANPESEVVRDSSFKSQSQDEEDLPEASSSMSSAASATVAATKASRPRCYTPNKTIIAKDLYGKDWHKNPGGTLEEFEAHFHTLSEEVLQPYEDVEKELKRQKHAADASGRLRFLLVSVDPDPRIGSP
ncbi:hypothetical protein WOLCODRAFT_154602 [Wolfiporia cocos MD-104 SS10]|uniref:Uncharacterized protein n=1 Tax=Wolfiporia cocos (strain MD-104) TaxID=742152 RepID=A0A2H3JRK3_WOLCO|nr:hypothetical protein WOLCODRAFT_154602 [Wolfiporia cocos MD-104 SS10]